MKIKYDIMPVDGMFFCEIEGNTITRYGVGRTKAEARHDLLKILNQELERDTRELTLAIRSVVRTKP